MVSLSSPPVADVTADVDDCAYELFRGAICQRDEAAWLAVVARYTPLVRHWVRQHSTALPAADEDARVNHTFERFARAVGPERFADFHNVASLMAYLKMCAATVVMDETRAARRHATVSLDALLGSDFAGPIAPDNLELEIERNQDADRLWSSIERALPDKSDRLLAYLSFVAALPPAAISQRLPDQFPTAADVYRRKARIIQRLRRSLAR